MAATYDTETFRQRYRDRYILVENLTLVYPQEKREKVKKEIEERLYDVFCKYTPN
ncbi:MAG: hypothetical protein HFG27_08275 [Provencibacterium sp.]|jgi:hypothetical protein|nr:hypothetical protein [Provencibacterium sp.]